MKHRLLRKLKYWIIKMLWWILPNIHLYFSNLFKTLTVNVSANHWYIYICTCCAESHLCAWQHWISVKEALGQFLAVFDDQNRSFRPNFGDFYQIKKKRLFHWSSGYFLFNFCRISTQLDLTLQSFVLLPSDFSATKVVTLLDRQTDTHRESRAQFHRHAPLFLCWWSCWK